MFQLIMVKVCHLVLQYSFDHFLKWSVNKKEEFVEQATVIKLRHFSFVFDLF